MFSSLIEKVVLFGLGAAISFFVGYGKFRESVNKVYMSKKSCKACRDTVDKFSDRAYEENKTDHDSINKKLDKITVQLAQLQMCINIRFPEQKK